MSDGHTDPAVVVEVRTAERGVRWKGLAVVVVSAARVDTRAPVIGLTDAPTRAASHLQERTQRELLHELVRREFDPVRTEETLKDLLGELIEVFFQIGLDKVSAGVEEMLHFHALTGQ